MSSIAENIQSIPGLSQLRRRTAVGLLRAWKEVKSSALTAIKGDEAIGDDTVFLRKQMALCLDSPGGEISQRAHTANLGRTYLRLDEMGRRRFLSVLARDFGLKQEKLAQAAQAYINCTEEKERPAREIALREQLVTPRSVILRQFTALPDGFKFLVNMRADLLPLTGADASLQGLEYDMKAILSAWFDIGLLDLAEITWNSPAALLEKIMEYEAVHRVDSWHDLKNRLDSDRRVFAFFHNKMPLEPLIFVHVALVSGMSDNIQQLLDENAPAFDVDEADTAIFYSISNAQRGLAGISFGNFLIKRVVSELTQEMRQIKTYATLSPVPGFMHWLRPLLESSDDNLLRPNEVELLRLFHPEKPATHALRDLLDTKWFEEEKTALMLKPILLRLVAHYLINKKKNGKPLDPVAAFHLFNGARLERLNWMGDMSAKGIRQSAGIMVNYHYKLDEIDDNHEVFAEHGKIVTGKQVKTYLE